MDGEKTWEARGRVTRLRGLIGIIAGGTGATVGMAPLVDCLGPLDLAQHQAGWRRRGAGSVPGPLPYPTPYAWVLADARRATPGVPYAHPSGAVIWVSLGSDVQRAFAAAVAGPTGA